MSKIIIRDLALTELGTVTDVYSAARAERINSDNVLSLTLPIAAPIVSLMGDDVVADIDGDYFDIAYYRKGQSADGSLVIDFEFEHVSYRLNEPDYDLDYFTQTGTPTAILTQLLAGTGFILGTIEFTASTTYSLQEATSRRLALMDFVAYLGAEVLFNGFTVSLLTQRGSATPKALTDGKNIEVMEKVYNKRELDGEGNPTVSYTCQLTHPTDIALGDNVTLSYPTLGISATLRVVSLTTDPYNQYTAEFEIGNFISGLEDSTRAIETSTLYKGKTYYGARISAESGFESIRSDLFARSVFNADEFAMQVGDGTGTSWTPVLYFDAVNKKFVFDGSLSANVIEAVKAEIDIVVSNTVIVNNLYAQYGRIADLTTNRFDTSFKKITNYLLKDTNFAASKADIQYQLMHEDRREIWVCTTDGLADGQALGANDAPLYWTDSTQTQMSIDITAYPVKQWVYDEVLKQEEGTELVNGVYIPYIIYGAGDGATAMSGRMKAQKLEDGYYWTYYKRTSGEAVVIGITDDGPVGIGGGGEQLTDLDFYANGFTAAYETEDIGFRWTKDGSGRITQLTNIYTSEVVPVTWNGGDM